MIKLTLATIVRKEGVRHEILGNYGDFVASGKEADTILRFVKYLNDSAGKEEVSVESEVFFE